MIRVMLTTISFYSEGGISEFVEMLMQCRRNALIPKVLYFEGRDEQTMLR